MVVEVTVVDGDAAAALMQRLRSEVDVEDVGFDLARQVVRIGIDKRPDDTLVEVLNVLETGSARLASRRRGRDRRPPLHARRGGLAHLFGGSPEAAAGSRMNVSTARSGSTCTCERNPITFRPMICSTSAMNLLHRVLERVPRLLHRLEAPALDQRPLDRRVDVLEEADHVVRAHHRSRSACPRP